MQTTGQKLEQQQSRKIDKPTWIKLGLYRSGFARPLPLTQGTVTFKLAVFCVYIPIRKCYNIEYAQTEEWRYIRCMDNLDFALQVMVLGFLVVMVTLFGLYGVLILFNRLLYQPVAAPAESKAAVEAKPAQGEGESAQEENGRVVAAILGAVYQYMQTEHAKAFTGPISIAVQTSGGAQGSSWKFIGRKEQLESSLELENIRRKNKRENI